MLGGSSGQHHTEKQVLKIDDPASPLNAGFGGQPFEHTDEFYHFPARAPYSREKQHILLSIDVEKSDMATSGQLCAPCTRPDQDYGMSWIKSYGKGRVFCTPLGHTPILFTTPAWTRHLMGGIQYILGDLDLDATPSAKLATKK
jgi:type 1 glutamine amidotransferase